MTALRAPKALLYLGLTLAAVCGQSEPGTNTAAHMVGCFERNTEQEKQDVPEIDPSYYSPGIKNGFGQGTVRTSCQGHCRTVAKATYYAYRRNGPAGLYARCYCLNDTSLLGQTTSSCGHLCGGESCGGASSGRQLVSVQTVCNVGYFGDAQCSGSCNCRGDNTVCAFTDGTCPPGGCKPGWQGNACNTDINECNANNGGCSHGCNNTAGSYICECPDGYKVKADRKTCGDVDECEENTDGCQQKCFNRPGSFFCQCHPGYNILSDTKTCGDIDECGQPSKGDCEQVCNNTVGSYTCQCMSGYLLADDLRGCNDVNECDQIPDVCELGTDTCYNIPGSYRCCDHGYSVLPQQTECTDIDECLSEDACDAELEECFNLAGSHHCCPQAEKYDNESGTCFVPAPVAAIVSSIVVTLLVVAGLLVAVYYIRRRNIIPNLRIKTNEKVLRQKRISRNRMSSAAEFMKDPEEHRTPKAHANMTFEDDEVPLADRENTYANVSVPGTSSKTRVRLEDFPQYVRKLKNSDRVQKEFESLPGSQLAPWTAACKRELKAKNRFRNILPYDHNRVLLGMQNDDPLSEYINASYISGYSYEDKFIAALGPRPNTVCDFWRMIWEQNVPLVVMVTNLVEGGNTKCTQYWPDSGTKEYDEVTVTIQKTVNWPDYTVRTFKIGTPDEQDRIVRHYHFTGWPDHGVPKDASALLNFRRKFRQHMIPHQYTVLHCSAGVGRTGTMIAIDCLIEESTSENSIDVFDCINALRQQRISMVQTKEQYIFVHEALAEYIMMGDTAIPRKEFIAVYQQLIQNPKKLNQQYNVLQQIAPTLDREDKEAPLSPDNVHKNRDPKIIPLACSRVFIQGGGAKGRNDYINAVAVPSARKTTGFLVTQTPLADTVVDFWRMVKDFSVKTIVVFKNKGQTQGVPQFLPTDGKPLTVLKYCVIMKSVVSEDGFREMELAIDLASKLQEPQYGNIQELTTSFSGLSSGSVLKVYEIMTGSDVECIPAHTVLAVYSCIQKWQKRSKDEPIVVTCLNGATFSGQFVACSNLIDMVNSNREVDVFQVVKHLRDRRPEFINTQTQYRFLYDMASLYLTETET